MNWEAIGAVGEVLGGMAVVLTLVYLSKQVRAGHAALLASQRQSAMDATMQWNDSIMRNHQLADVVWRGVKDYDSLSPTERVQFGHTFFSFFKASENIWAQHLKDPTGGDVWQAHQLAVLMYARQPGVGDWLRNTMYLFDPVFAEMLQEELEKSSPRQTDSSAGMIPDSF